MASSRMLVLQVRKWMKIWEKVHLCTPPGSRTAKQKVKKKGNKSAVAILKITRQLVAYFKIWSRRRLQRFCWRAQTYRSQSDVFDSPKPCYVMLTFETRIHRLEWFAQVILISVTPMLQKLRIGLKKRRNGKSKVPVKQRGGWLKASWN